MAGGSEKKSMLDVITRQMKEENRHQVIHCTTLVSRLSPGVNDKREIGVHYEELFKQCHSQYQGEGPTGMLFVYPEHVVHMVECSWELVEAILRDALTQAQSSSGLVKETKILNFSTNVSPRLYPQWAYRVLPLPTMSKTEAYETSETIAQTVTYALSPLYKLGAHLTLNRHKVKDILNDLKSEFLLAQDLLEYFTKCEDLDSPAQFIARYCGPTQVVLDTELVWPLPNRLFPYDD